MTLLPLLHFIFMCTFQCLQSWILCLQADCFSKPCCGDKGWNPNHFTAVCKSASLFRSCKCV